MYKKIIIALLLTPLSFANAQVIIGDATGTAPVKNSVLLEFANTDNKGIIVPYVRTLPATPAEGTILLDASTATTARMKFYNGSWKDLSGQDADVSTALTNQPTGISENSGSKAIIGAVTSAADGVLVLESANKAMVLPVVSDVQNIQSPSPGMMVYVKGTTDKFLAVYNGSKWSFWKPTVEIVPTVTTATGRIWMDRNLGASRVATSSNDVAAYGDLYQWGRGTDGHQLRTSATTTTLSTTDTPGNGNFITSSSDWRSPGNNTLWQGVNGINNPCPSGFRLPTEPELNAETALFSPQSPAGAFASPLKMTIGGYKSFNSGTITSVNTNGYYWTSSVLGVNSFARDLSNGSGYIPRGYGMSVRCIKN